MHREKKVYLVIRKWISGEQGYPLARAQVSEIAHAPNLKNKIGAGSPCTIRCRVYAHSKLEKLWRESEAIQRERDRKRDNISTQRYFALRFLRKAKSPKSNSQIMVGSELY